MLAQNPSILITDDDRAFRETVRGVLEPRGFRTLAASDGEEALKIVSSQPIHLLLVDMHMPRLTGIDTLQRIRQLNSRLPCVLLSAALDELIVRQAQLAEVFAVLAKPVSRNDIMATVDQAFRVIYDWPQQSGPSRTAKAG